MIYAFNAQADEGALATQGFCSSDIADVSDIADSRTYTIIKVLFPSILLIFSVALTGLTLAYMQFIYSS